MFAKIGLSTPETDDSENLAVFRFSCSFKVSRHLVVDDVGYM
jgi:hypothetical protein